MYAGGMVDDPVSPVLPASNDGVMSEVPNRPEPTSDLSGQPSESAPATESANTQPVPDQPTVSSSQPTETPSVSQVSDPPQPPPSPVEPASISTQPETDPSISTPSAQVVPPVVEPTTNENQTVQTTTEPQTPVAPEPNPPQNEPAPAPASPPTPQAIIPSLQHPFYGSFPITFDFGAQPVDDAMVKKYQEWGITGHNGIDFGLPVGTEILACDEGIVTQVGDNGDFGISITIEHSWGTSIYGHLQSFGVLVNDHVSKAQLVGASDTTGYASGPHLHFGIQPNAPDTINGYLGYIDPNPYLKESLPAPQSPISPVVPQVSEPPQPEAPPDLSGEKPTEESSPSVPETPIAPPQVPIAPQTPVVPAVTPPVVDEEVVKQQAVAMFDARQKENSAKGNQAKKAKRDEALQKIFMVAQEKKRITNEQVRDILHISQSTASTYLTELVTRGMLKVEGKGKATVYTF